MLVGTKHIVKRTPHSIEMKTLFLICLPLTFFGQSAMITSKLITSSDTIFPNEPLLISMSHKNWSFFPYKTVGANRRYRQWEIKIINEDKQDTVLVSNRPGVFYGRASTKTIMPLESFSDSLWLWNFYNFSDEGHYSIEVTKYLPSLQRLFSDYTSTKKKILVVEKADSTRVNEWLTERMLLHANAKAKDKEFYCGQIGTQRNEAAIPHQTSILRGTLTQKTSGWCVYWLTEALRHNMDNQRVIELSTEVVYKYREEISAYKKWAQTNNLDPDNIHTLLQNNRVYRENEKMINFAIDVLKRVDPSRLKGIYRNTYEVDEKVLNQLVNLVFNN